ncbi:protein PAM68, chloroplastic-like [Zingiber officinale]|uniref:Protein PAM68, chloroplastic n=1 Tax=Zingiber officinale TaxID=94328 RepID=A0A8J5GC35_ZINOF|nr:protein PAM68, chloroplastic-like [Zingiber officinale]KAG6504321.1 hypothetical protein ZIOFF_036652 [Zingiber officinale]
MNALSFLRPTALAPLQSPYRFSDPSLIPRSRLHPPRSAAALNSPRGFGPSPRKSGKNRKSDKRPGFDEDDEDEIEDEDDGGGIIPEAVTNRMMRRMGVSIGIPLFVGLLFFPFFYYLKAVAKLDVPSWVPVLVSFFFFGASLLGISYGIVSASWDPLREGSFLGWTEAQRNWPVFWQSLRGGGRLKGK